MSFREKIQENLNHSLNNLRSVKMPPCANFGMSCIKILLMLVNVLFLILGILLISVGTTIHAVYNDVQELLGAEWFSPALMLTVLGVLVLLVTAFGCLGTFKNSTCMINTFGALLLVLFILEVIAAVSSFAMSGTVNALIARSLKHSFSEYVRGDEVQRERVDFLQQELHCCGINKPDDWYKLLGGHDLPDSCCAYYRHPGDYGYVGRRSSGYGTDAPDQPECVPFEWGCTRALHDLINVCAVVLSAGTVIVCIIQILGVTFAFQLAKSIRQAKTRQDMERCAILRQEVEPFPQAPPELDQQPGEKEFHKPT